MNELEAFQQGFARALWQDGHERTEAPQVAHLARQPAFRVYRNTVLKGCIDALQANHPGVLQLVGEEWFRSAAALYVHSHPPAGPCLLRYGATHPSFAEFLRAFEPAAHLPYLHGVALLDAAWTECHTAADAPAAPPALLATLAPEALGGQRLRPHPATRWHWFADAPVFTIWCAGRDGTVLDDRLDWRGEGALLTRPLDAVQWAPLSAAGCAFLEACAAGLNLGEAAEAALRAEPACDLAALLALLLHTGALALPAEPLASLENP